MEGGKSKLKAKFDYRFLGIWMALGNIIQFITNIVGEDKIKSWYDGRIRALLFIFAIPLLSFFFGKTDFAIKIEKEIKENESILNWGGNICFLLVICFLIRSF